MEKYAENLLLSAYVSALCNSCKKKYDLITANFPKPLSALGFQNEKHLIKEGYCGDDPFMK